MKTADIQSIINNASKNNTVAIIPSGVHEIATIELPSNIEIFFEDGAVLRGVRGLENYQKVGYHHNELGDVISMIFAKDQKNIKIYGNGVIDFNGFQYYENFSERIPEKFKNIITPEQIEECCYAHAERLNQPMFFLQCEKITIQDIKLINAPTWGTTFVEGKDIKVDNIEIDYSLKIPNSDGLHFCSCENVEVRNSIISAGDDCIAFTSITNWDKPSRNLKVDNCRLRTCSKAISIGYMHSDVENVEITNTIIEDSNRGIVIMQNPYTGSVKNVKIDNLMITTKVYAGDWWGNGEPICLMAVDHQLGHRGNFKTSKVDKGVSNIEISNLLCEGENKMAFLGEDNIHNLSLNNIIFKKRESKNLMLKGNVIDLAPCENHFSLDGLEEYDCIIKGAKNVTLKNLKMKVGEL